MAKCLRKIKFYINKYVKRKFRLTKSGYLENQSNFSCESLFRKSWFQIENSARTHNPATSYGIKLSKLGMKIYMFAIFFYNCLSIYIIQHIQFISYFLGYRYFPTFQDHCALGAGAQWPLACSHSPYGKLRGQSRHSRTRTNAKLSTCFLL